MLESTIKVDDELALKYLQDIMGKMEIIDVLSTSNMYLNYLIHSKVEKIKSLNIDLTCGFKNTLDFLNLFVFPMTQMPCHRAHGTSPFL